MFVILVFVESKEIAIVPATWLNEEDECAWPGASKEVKMLFSLIRKENRPGHNWKKFKV